MLNLPYISTRSRLYLPHISPYISPVSPPYGASGAAGGRGGQEAEARRRLTKEARRRREGAP